MQCGWLWEDMAGISCRANGESVMRDRSVARSVAVAVAIIAFVGAGGGAALAQTPIGPQQHFVGMVNGQEGSAVVYTVCPGPVTEHRTGPVQKGQTMAVAEAAHGHGDTGLFSQIYSWFQPVPAGTRPVTLTFKQYGEPQGIPRSVRVPCSGKGEAVFSSCPYLAPCAAGFIWDTLKVTFENIAVTSSRGGMDRRR
jgi:hypothetical protein